MDNEILRKAVEIGSWMNLTRAQWLDMIVAPRPLALILLLGYLTPMNP